MDSVNQPKIAILHQIADTLNVPMEQFFSKDLHNSVNSDPSQCLRIWFKLKTAEGRLRALEALRMLVAQEDPE